MTASPSSTDSQALRLIVGLGNPGPQYADTRHNAGAWWVQLLADRFAIPLSAETKFKGLLGRGTIAGVDVRLLLPSTFMNHSGQSVGAVCQFYKISLDTVLVAYDEMAFDPGVVRIKQGGGDNGHNGIKSVRAGCGNNAGFHRLRMGVGHPGSKDLVTPYLTGHTTPAQERQAILAAVDFPEAVLSDMLHGRWQSAMNVIHAKGENSSGI